MINVHSKYHSIKLITFGAVRRVVKACKWLRSIGWIIPPFVKYLEIEVLHEKNRVNTKGSFQVNFLLKLLIYTKKCTSIV